MPAVILPPDVLRQPARNADELPGFADEEEDVPADISEIKGTHILVTQRASARSVELLMAFEDARLNDLFCTAE
jgi:hypothetical protein